MPYLDFFLKLKKKKKKKKKAFKWVDPIGPAQYSTLFKIKINWAYIGLRT
jgi:hypothetical protein